MSARLDGGAGRLQPWDALLGAGGSQLGGMNGNARGPARMDARQELTA